VKKKKVIRRPVVYGEGAKKKKLSKSIVRHTPGVEGGKGLITGEASEFSANPSRKRD